MIEYHVLHKPSLLSAWSTLDGVVRPFVLTDVLDETLAGGYVNVSGLDAPPEIRPFDFVQIQIQKDDDPVVVKYFKAADIHTEKTRFTWHDEYKYEVRIDLVELTKDLERIVCDTLTFTNYLGKTYPTSTVLIRPEVWNEEAGVTVSVQPPAFFAPVPTAIPVRIPSTLERLWAPESTFFVHRNFSPNDHHKIKLYHDSTVVFEYEADGNAAVPNGEWTFTAAGSYTLVYEGTYTRIISAAAPGGQLTHPRYRVTYVFSAISDMPTLANWTISSVVQRILDVGRPGRKGLDKPLFEPFDQHEYDNIPAPEFYITRSTMFDALMTVGGAIHAIPRIDYVENGSDKKLYVRFTKLGGNTVKEIEPALIFEEREWNADEYSGVFDSTVENMMNTRDIIGGAVVEPSGGSYKTVRSSAGDVRICADTMEILTQFPIQQIVKVELAMPYNGALEEYDITPFVYEEAEYDALSEYNQNASYPYSKAWAICYKQGDNRLTGLNFRLKDAVNFKAQFQKYAIVNIIKSVSGHDVQNNDLIDIAFRVTYIPRVTARLKQYKPVLGGRERGRYLQDGKSPSRRNELIYNQSGNTVENFYYGERLRGATARLGNEVVTRTYVFDGPDKIPECGDIIMVDGRKMYLAIINQEFDRLHIRATLKMTPNFNKLNEWVGLDSNYRLYDVSEKQTAQRLINYSETCLISHSDKPYAWYKNALLQTVAPIMNTLLQEDYPGRPRYAYLKGTVTSLPITTISSIALPVAACGVGNSLCFTAMFPDNYGAGYQAIGCDPQFKTGTEQQFTRIARNVPYSDAYGRLPYLHISLRDKVFTPSAAAQTANNGRANTLPEIVGSPPSGNIVTFDTTNSPLHIEKDSREQLTITLQQHFQAETDDIVIGKLLIQNNMLITNARREDVWETRDIHNAGTETTTTVESAWVYAGGFWRQQVEWPVHHWMNTGDTQDAGTTEFTIRVKEYQEPVFSSWTDYARVPGTKPSWDDAQFVDLHIQDYRIRVWRSVDAIYTQAAISVAVMSDDSTTPPAPLTYTDREWEMVIRFGINRPVRPRVCLLTEPLNALRQQLNPATIYDTGIEIAGLLVNESDNHGRKFRINSFTNEDTSDRIYTGWAVVDMQTKEFYIGVNEEIGPGDTTSPLKFYFLTNHELEEDPD